MREDPKSFKEWLESKGNPKHTVSEGDDGFKVVVVEDTSNNSAICLYRFKEDSYNGYKTFWISNGWCVSAEYFQAIEDYLDSETIEWDDEEDNPESEPEPKEMRFEVWDWFVDSTGDTESERCIDFIYAMSKSSAAVFFTNGLSKGKYPKTAWLVLNGEKMEIDTKGWIPA